jgi:type IV fimbrial biogenesis protein FimT
MLTARLRGFTLIELMIGIALFALLMTLAIPSFTTMMNNTRLRDKGASIMSGLQSARGEALRRNLVVEFALTADPVTDGSDIGVAANGTGPTWVVRALDALGTPTGTLVDFRSGLEGSNQTDPAALYTRIASASLPPSGTIRFDSLGRTNVSAANGATFDVTPADANQCRAQGGDLRCMRVVVTTSGRVRMCDPSVDPVVNPNDTRACTP